MGMLAALKAKNCSYISVKNLNQRYTIELPVDPCDVDPHPGPQFNLHNR